MESEKEIRGRFRVGTLKISVDSIQQQSKQNISDLASKCEQLIKDVKTKDESMARLRLNDTKYLFCFVKDHKALLFIYDTEKNIITQNLTVDEMKEILHSKNSMLMRLENQDRILTPDNKKEFINLLQYVTDPNATRGSPDFPEIDDDFDNRYQ